MYIKIMRKGRLKSSTHIAKSQGTGRYNPDNTTGILTGLERNSRNTCWSYHWRGVISSKAKIKHQSDHGWFYQPVTGDIRRDNSGLKQMHEWPWLFVFVFLLSMIFFTVLLFFSTHVLRFPSTGYFHDYPSRSIFTSERTKVKREGMKCSRWEKRWNL